MFTQLFGSFLLNKKIVAAEQLKDALDYQKSVHLKLGVLAVNAGFMTSADINEVHNMQSKKDKKFGELAIEMGFLTEEKLNILLSTQKSGHLLLGQALVDKNYLTLEQFENALNMYKNEHHLTNDQFRMLQNGDVDEIVNALYNFTGCSECEIYKSYFSLLIRNIIRFIDADFTPKDKIQVSDYKFNWVATQDILGEIELYTGIGGKEKAIIGFAGKFANETYTVNDEYTQAAVGEFLNQINGMFLVNMSDNNIELELTPQVTINEGSLTDLTEAYCIPVEFSFGRIDFIISKSKPFIKV
ncbi:MAG: hypothetical protein Q8942_07925 [Bacillota bacterium]|nr:hypothetical protein [Bacillota bacterium]